MQLNPTDLNPLVRCISRYILRMPYVNQILNSIMMKSLRLLLHLSILSIICITGTSIGHTQVNTNDSLALVAIYHATNGDQWKENTNWLTDKPVSEWFGITVENGRVSIVKLNKIVKSEYIPVDISKPTEMAQSAVESNENLTGQIPPFINDIAMTERLDVSR